MGSGDKPGPRKVFHSWRHAVATIMCDKGVREARAFHITSHAPASKGAAYIHHSIAEMAVAIELIPNPCSLGTQAAAPRPLAEG